MVVDKKSQMNIQIDPKLLIAVKSEAIKSGKTLSAYVTERLVQPDGKVKDDILEQRLLRIEDQLDLLNKYTSDIEDKKNPIRSIFSDSGAKKYGEVAKELFDLHRKEKKLSFKDAFEELSIFLANYDSQPELVFDLLSGRHDLTGLEMTIAYKKGSCSMRNALNDWTKSRLEPLNEAFLNAVQIENLA